MYLARFSKLTGLTRVLPGAVATAEPDSVFGCKITSDAKAAEYEWPSATGQEVCARWQ